MLANFLLRHLLVGDLFDVIGDRFVRDGDPQLLSFAAEQFTDHDVALGIVLGLKSKGLQERRFH